MSKYHINSKQMPGVCKAKNKCPYGDINNDHYDSKESTMKAIETQSLVEATYEKALSEYDDRGVLSDKTIKELEKVKGKLGDNSTFDKNYLSKINSLYSANKEVKEENPPKNISELGAKYSKMLDEGAGLTDYEKTAYDDVLERINGSYDANELKGEIEELINNANDDMKNHIFANPKVKRDNFIDGTEQMIGVYSATLSEINKISEDKSSKEFEKLSFNLPHDPNEGELNAHRLTNITLKSYQHTDNKDSVESLETTRQILEDEIKNVIYDIDAEVNKPGFVKENGSQSLQNLESEKEYYENAIDKINKRINEMSGKSNSPTIKDAVINTSHVKSDGERGYASASDNVEQLLKNSDKGSLDKLREIAEIIDGERINTKIELDALPADTPKEDREYLQGKYNAYAKHAETISNTVKIREASAKPFNTTEATPASGKLNGSNFKAKGGKTEKEYHTDANLANAAITHRGWYKAHNGLTKYEAPERYATTNAGRLNPFTMQSSDNDSQELVNDNSEKSYIILSQEDGKRARVIMGSGESIKDIEAEFGRAVTQEKHGAVVGITEGLNVVGYISKDGERYGYIPNKSVSFFSFD